MNDRHTHDDLDPASGLSSEQSERVENVEDERTISVSNIANPPPVLPIEAVDSIGGYRILGVLGEGGMGVVYDAEQSSPHRRVALKVMRRGHTVDEVHARMFHHEAQTLARLRHPKIAAIFESGHTVDGHDFFAMELVRGQTLGNWLDSRPAPRTAGEVRTRLRLFQSLCEPVHYAHQRGVIHRDLKPANIMVTEDHDGGIETGAKATPGVKILDFGLARIADPDMEAATLMSEVGVIRGTLPYMSPEQTRSEAEAIDVRTDVYALGVILYEMITGRRPYDLDSSSLIDAVRIICEELPQPINTQARAGITLDADLETIVGKALEKEPERRYGSVSELADDIERYLSSRPILARRPSASYRTRKFVQRHRAGVAAAALVVVAILAGVVGISVGLVRAKNAEAHARREAATSAKVSQLPRRSVGYGRCQACRAAAARRPRAAGGGCRNHTRRDAAGRGRGVSQSHSGRQRNRVGRLLVDDAILSRAGEAIARAIRRRTRSCRPPRTHPGRNLRTVRSL